MSILTNTINLLNPIPFLRSFIPEANRAVPMRTHLLALASLTASISTGNYMFAWATGVIYSETLLHHFAQQTQPAVGVRRPEPIDVDAEPAIEEEGAHHDPVTGDPIPAELEFALSDGQWIDLRSLLSHFVSSGTLENPFTRIPLSNAQVAAIQANLGLLEDLRDIVTEPLSAEIVANFQAELDHTIQTQVAGLMDNDLAVNTIGELTEQNNAAKNAFATTTRAQRLLVATTNPLMGAYLTASFRENGWL